MPYHLDAENSSLGDLQKRIEATDLVPSRASLLEGIEVKMKALEQQGITTLARLRNELKTSKRLEALAKATGIEPQYLILLRREIEGYFPRPFALKSFDWLPKSEIAKLEQNGIKDTAALYEASNSRPKRTALVKATGADGTILETLAQLADLTRVQWVSPTAARMLVEAGWTSAAEVARADADELDKALVRVNAGNRFFKGKIGLRDVKRLIHAAQYT
jgi:predicted flap endonuclease-1-like 5' DNA nuclease